MTQPTYKIVRFYKDTPADKRVIKRGLTFQQARAHCADPETSSTTCKLPSNVRHTERMGPWFDGYDEEK